MAAPRRTRPISWVRAALKEFEKFPEDAKSVCLAALTMAAEGGKADIAKPMRGLVGGYSRLPLRFVAMHFGWSMLCNSRMRFGSSMRFRKNRRKVSRPPNARLISLKNV